MDENRFSRRNALRMAGVSVAGHAAWTSSLSAGGQDSANTGKGIRILNPRARVPLSFIIDDSTCLVNMGHFCMPQFARAWPERETYRQPWKEWPREIPDSFVREFGEWCAQHDVKGKYSIVPYPACVGWLDRGLPGWSHKDLDNSLRLVRELMMPNWDIHPEMITHTHVIDLKTGRPMEPVNSATMENSYPQSDISTDHLTEYLAYALRILKNCGLECEGITTPGGFGNRVKEKLPIAVRQAVRDVFSTELPHYFKYVHSGDESTAPKLEYDGEKVLSNLTVNVPAGTGDWFGGWEGTKTPQPDLYCNMDATDGRMVQMIERGEPAVMLCHWPGMYCNGTKAGFNAFKRVVLSLRNRYRSKTIWMKVSEIGRYETAKQLTSVVRADSETVQIDAPIGCKDFTFEIDSARPKMTPVIQHEGKVVLLRDVNSVDRLSKQTFATESDRTVVCIDLPKGISLLKL